MKLIFVLFALLLAVKGEISMQELVDTVTAKVTEVGLACAEKLDISSAAMEQLTQHKVPTEHDGKCVILCIQEHFGMMDDKGNVNKEKILMYMEPVKAINEEMYKKGLEVIDICIKVKHDDPCEIAALGMQCFIDEMKKRGVNPEFFGF